MLLLQYCKPDHCHKAPPKVKKKEYPTYGTICQLCGRANHFEAMWESKEKPLSCKHAYMNIAKGQA